MGRAKGWVCRRQANGKKCLTRNAPRTRKCHACNKPKPAKKPPTHKVILGRPYEEWVELYGEHCNICGKGRSASRRLDRDHDHATGKSRGTLCWACNSNLRGWMTSDWLRRAADYLDRNLHL